MKNHVGFHRCYRYQVSFQKSRVVCTSTQSVERYTPDYSNSTMSAPIEFNLSRLPIYDHCFSYDRKTVAITKDTNVEIYDISMAGRPKLIATLTHHDKTITAVDISRDGKIVTCSQDRNALVWELQADGKYKATLVLLRINRAATCVRWSPNGLKFAVGSSARVVAICHYEAENNWWISKHIKKPLKSTVLALDWHPNSVLLAVGSSDGHARVFSSFIKNVDEKPAPTIWGERLPFQTLCGDYTFHGVWVHGIAFAPSGDFIACVGHDSSVSFIYPSGNPEAPEQAQVAYTVKSSSLPFKAILFVNESKVVVAGHDCHPFVFEGDASSGWQETYQIDDPKSKAKGEQSEQSALNMFRQLDLKGSATQTSSALSTVHQNTINTIRAFQSDSHNVLRISTSGNDGKVVIFDI